MSAARPRATSDAGAIHSGSNYTVRGLCARLRLGPHALRQLKAAGLRTHRVGHLNYVLGGDVVDLFGRLAAADQSAEARP